LCQTQITEEGEVPLDEASRQQILAAIADCSARGMRTLALAFKDGAGISGEEELVEVADNLTWLGFVAIADPVRPEVKDAVARCRAAGIEVKIVTGDNPYTASEIGRQIGLFGDDPHAGARPGEAMPDDVMLGSDFMALSDEEALDAAQRLKVLARARPADKLRLVNSLSARDAVVAVTGDGTNDAPALNQAAVGLAMGKAGTAVAKEASDIILLDDSFGSIATAVKWGRALYLNIQKFILFQLTINVAACGIAFLGPFIGVDLPLTVMQMLWVNLIMDTFAALALATEPPEERVMEKKPRGPEEFIVSGPMLKAILLTGGAFLVLYIWLLRVHVQGLPLPFFGGDTVPERLTIFFTVFVLLQFWNQFNARTLGSTKSAFSGVTENPYFLSISAAILVGQILIVSFGGEAFRVVPLGLETWVKMLVATSFVLWFGEIARFFMRAGGNKEVKREAVAVG
jgi:Ca2+-transporting ATPase